MSVNDVLVTSIPHLTLSDPALDLEVAALRLAIISRKVELQEGRWSFSRKVELQERRRSFRRKVEPSQDNRGLERPHGTAPV
ncbi:unnamed protein product [Arctogadus glacialis]